MKTKYGEYIVDAYKMQWYHKTVNDFYSGEPGSKAFIPRWFGIIKIWGGLPENRKDIKKQRNVFWRLFLLPCRLGKEEEKQQPMQESNRFLAFFSKGEVKETLDGKYKVI